MAREREKWADEQAAVLIELGIDPADAQRSVSWVLDNCPADTEPGDWQPTESDLREQAASAASIADSRADWFAAAHIELKYKRLLDARIESDE